IEHREKETERERERETETERENRSAWVHAYVYTCGRQCVQERESVVEGRGVLFRSELNTERERQRERERERQRRRESTGVHGCMRMCTHVDGSACMCIRNFHDPHLQPQKIKGLG